MIEGFDVESLRRQQQETLALFALRTAAEAA
jgi:hypothetical protein